MSALSNNKMQRTKHCPDGASPLILVLDGRHNRTPRAISG